MIVRKVIFTFDEVINRFFLQCWHFLKIFEWKLLRTFNKIICERSTAFLGVLSPRARRRKLMTKSYSDLVMVNWSRWDVVAPTGRIHETSWLNAYNYWFFFATLGWIHLDSVFFLTREWWHNWLSKARSYILHWLVNIFPQRALEIEALVWRYWGLDQGIPLSKQI